MDAGTARCGRSEWWRVVNGEERLVSFQRLLGTKYLLCCFSIPFLKKTAVDSA